MSTKNLILEAAAFARRCHAGQLRKYTGRPYLEHPARVAMRVMLRDDATEEMVIGAWLHDVVEDTGVSLTEIRTRFGDGVARLVGQLTNASHGSRAPRAERKARDRLHLTAGDREAKLIKLIDRIDNLHEMDAAPERFLRTYLAESSLLGKAIGEVDVVLRTELNEQIARLVTRLSRASE